MKRISSFVIVCLALFSTSIKATTGITDTTGINHILDGLTKEWPDTNFTTDPETQVKYAFDNNNEFLFIAMRVPEFRMQMKLGRNAMKLFIDPKAKKKESKGIEFPVKSEAPTLTMPPGDGDMRSAPAGEKPHFDKKMMRASFASNMLYMNVFGFDESGTQSQGLDLPGKANIAFAWDSADVMHIEYRIPLSLLGDLNSLDNKEFSIGWKINGRQFSANREGGGEAGGEGMRGGGRGRGEGGGGYGGGRGFGGGGNRFGGGGGNNSHDRTDMEKMMKDQSIWNKYTIHLIPVKKGF